MSRDSMLYIHDIIEAIQRIEEYVEGMNFEVFCQNRRTQDAVVRNLEIIGEAASRMDESFRMVMAEIEWRKIIGLRNILIHEYFGINQPIIWDVVQNKLESLKDACTRMSEETSEN